MSDLPALLRDSEWDAERRADCPANELLWDAARGAASGSDTEAVVAHTGGCTACSADWALASALAREAGELRAPSSAGTPAWRSWKGLALAAAVVAVMLFVPRPWEDRRTGSTLRENEGAARIRALAGLEDALPRGDFHLRWTPVPDATSYMVIVTTEDLRPLHRAVDLEGTEYVVPPAALAGVPDGARVVWRVSAVRRRGAVVVSEAFITRVAAER